MVNVRSPTTLCISIAFLGRASPLRVDIDKAPELASQLFSDLEQLVAFWYLAAVRSVIRVDHLMLVELLTCLETLRALLTLVRSFGLVTLLM
jgi:hypothetical protein